MAKIYSAYGERKKPAVATAGERLRKLYRETLDNKGQFTGIEPTGEYDDQYAKIQSYKESTDIHTILEKAANGDISALNQRQGRYIDVSAMPTNYNDLVKAYKQGQETIMAYEKTIKEMQEIKNNETKEEKVEDEQKQ